MLCPSNLLTATLLRLLAGCDIWLHHDMLVESSQALSLTVLGASYKAQNEVRVQYQLILCVL